MRRGIFQALPFGLYILLFFCFVFSDWFISLLAILPECYPRLPRARSAQAPSCFRKLASLDFDLRWEGRRFNGSRYLIKPRVRYKIPTLSLNILLHVHASSNGSSGMEILFMPVLFLSYYSRSTGQMRRRDRASAFALQHGQPSSSAF